VDSSSRSIDHATLTLLGLCVHALELPTRRRFPSVNCSTQVKWKRSAKELPASPYSGGAMIVIRTARGGCRVTATMQGGHYEPTLLNQELSDRD